MKAILFALVLASSAQLMAQSAADREMKLQAIYSQHAKTSSSFNDPVKSAAEQACADAHATAAEKIMESPVRAIAASKRAKLDCDNFLQMAEIQKAKIERDKLIDNCGYLKQHSITMYAHDNGYAISCRAVGIELSEPEPPAGLGDECRTFVGKAYSEWPAKCAPVSSGLREYLTSKK